MRPIFPELRPCFVDNRKALFHCWGQESEIVAPSPMVGGHNGGVVAAVVGIVEFEDGTVERHRPYNIKFVPGIAEEYCWGYLEETK